MNNKLGIGLIGIFILLVFIGHLPSEQEMKGEVMAQEIAPTTVPEPKRDVSNIKVSEVTITEYQPRNFITVKVSHYWPNLGGVNCLTFKNGECVSKMANGETWQSGVGKNIIACPKEFKFGTQIKILGNTYTCKDRGSMIVKTEDNKYWVDMLQEKALVPYGEEVRAEVL